MIKDGLKNAAEMALVYSMVAAMFGVLFYPAWSDSREYMVEWSFLGICGVTVFILVQGHEMNYSPKLLPVVALVWLYAMGQAARTQSFAQLPCTAWEKTTCWDCTEREVTRSGEQCISGEAYECEVCTERTWRARDWK